MEKQKLPNASTALVMGILSIVTACCCYGVPGVIFGFIGLNMAKKAKATHDENPEQYNGLGNVEAGRITSIIGLVLGALFTIYLIYMISNSGGIFEMIEQQKQMIEQMQNQ
ncbi:MAG: DUF4190 domain-containing protein [Flavobacteriaceae bacterium]|nr:DUF4190 domain-containing protein [Flavobacteriaceae bacterium]